MPALLSPFSFFLACLAGWFNQHQQVVIEYLTEENRVLVNRSVTGDSTLPTINGDGLPPSRKN